MGESSMSGANPTRMKGRLVAAVLAAGLVSASSASASTCTGTLYTYYETAACQQIVSSKVVCPGFPDQTDTDSNGNFIQTPYFLTQVAVCPCPGSNGGGSGGGDTDEDAPPP